MLLKKLDPLAGFSLSQSLPSPIKEQRGCFIQQDLLGLHIGLVNFCDLSEKVAERQLLFEDMGITSEMP